jgi:hypothetical protein
MFEEIFFPWTAERYRAAPLLEQRERYLVHLRETGARRPTLRKCANDQLGLVRLLELKDGARVRVSQIEAATAIWSQPKGRRCERSASPKARTRFVNHAVRWLRFLGWLDEADKDRHRHGAEVDAYEAWMRGDRGLSEESGRRHSPLHPRSPAVGLRPRAILHDVRADPATQPPRLRENRQRPPGCARHCHREAGNPCVAACGGAASS